MAKTPRKTRQVGPEVDPSPALASHPDAASAPKASSETALPPARTASSDLASTRQPIVAHQVQAHVLSDLDAETAKLSTGHARAYERLADVTASASAFLEPSASRVIDNRGSRGPDFAAMLAEIAALDIGELRIRYRKLLRKTPPAHLPRWLLARIVAYQVQARILGDLDTEIVKLLTGLARAHERDLKARAEAAQHGQTLKPTAVPVVPPVSTRGKLAIGTELVREYGDEMHRVTVIETGFIWQGRTFTSLSQIAKLITGTSWNGPYFFGLREKSKAIPMTSGSVEQVPASNRHVAEMTAQVRRTTRSARA